jgi:hypothetical protein
MRRIFMVLIFLLSAWGGLAWAEPLGFAVGAELILGDLADNNYRFAGKADPAFKIPAGQGIIRPFVNYNKTLGDFMFNGNLSYALGFNNPQITQLKITLTGAYTLSLNNNTSRLMFSLNDLFKLNTYDWSIKVQDDLTGGWNNTAIPTIRFTQVFGFGSVYGQFSSPIYVADLDTAPGPEYEKPFFFGDIQVGVDTIFGAGLWLRPVLQLSPDPGDTPNAAYDVYSSDIAFQQLDLGFSFTNAAGLTALLTFSFPIPGDKEKPDGIKDQGFKIAPVVAYKAGPHMVTFRLEILNLGQDVGVYELDRVLFKPSIEYGFSF